MLPTPVSTGSGSKGRFTAEFPLLSASQSLRRDSPDSALVLSWCLVTVKRRCPDRLCTVGLLARARNDLSIRTGSAPQRWGGCRPLPTGDASDGCRHLGVIAFTLASQPHGLVAAAFCGGIRDRGQKRRLFPPFLTGSIARTFAKRDWQIARRHGQRRPQRGAGNGAHLFGMYNSLDAIDRLAVALERVSAGRLRASYRQDRDSGEFVAEGSPMDPAGFFDFTVRLGWHDAV